MEEIKCPKCGSTIKIDKNIYADILEQVKGKEFKKALDEKMNAFEEKKDAESKLMELSFEGKIKDIVNEYEAKIIELTQKIDSSEEKKILAVKETEAAKDALISDKDKEILILKQQKKEDLEKANILFDKERQGIVNGYEAKIIELTQKIDSSEEKKKLAVKETEAVKDAMISEKDQEIIRLRNTIENFGAEKQIAITEAIKEKDEEINKQMLKINELDSQIKTDLLKHQADLITMENGYKNQIKHMDEEINYYKDFKARQSTKMVGESLEQFCLNEFNSNRALGFKKAYFGKDNDASSGSKGDFIFRDFTEDNIEYVSIMFEMKNECDTTATKKTNESFFKELDKDRREKNCEYAVLVSMLESDSDYYNMGIVDVSIQSGYEKMYVIRPQFFIPMITLLRNAALNSVEYQRELTFMRNQNIDISKFEDNMNEFKDAFQKNYQSANKKFLTAVDEIDKTIALLNKIKDNLLSSENQLRLANNKAQDLSIKKLTKGNPTMKKKFEELAEKTEIDIEQS